MSLSSRDQQVLARIETELSGDRRLIELAGYVGKRAAFWRRLGLFAVLWAAFPLAVCGTGGLVAALVVHAWPVAAALVPVLVLLWPLVGYVVWRRWHNWRILL